MGRKVGRRDSRPSSINTSEYCFPPDIMRDQSCRPFSADQAAKMRWMSETPRQNEYSVTCRRAGILRDCTGNYCQRLEVGCGGELGAGAAKITVEKLGVSSRWSKSWRA
jgi:hypothetical protein